MNTNDELGRRLAGHFREMAPARAPDWMLTDARVTRRLTRQRRTQRLGPWRIAPGLELGSTWRTAPVLLLLGALIAASIGAALIAARGLMNQPQLPSPFPATIITGPGEPIDAAWPGTWELDSEQESLTMSLSVGGEAIISPLGPYIFGRMEPVDPISQELTIFKIVGCDGAGRYDVRLTSAEPVDWLTLTAIDDPCSSRRLMLEGQWDRRTIDRAVTPASRYRLDLAGTKIVMTVPTAFAGSDGGGAWFTGDAWDGWNGKFTNGDLRLTVMKETGSGSAAVDRCRGGEGPRTTPTNLTDYLAWTRASVGLGVIDATSTMVAGLPAMKVDLLGGPDCTSRRDPMPPAGPASPTHVDSGRHQREWAVDVGGRIVLLMLADDAPPYEPLTPDHLAIGQAFIDSIEITPTP